LGGVSHSRARRVGGILDEYGGADLGGDFVQLLYMNSVNYELAISAVYGAIQGA
jgi:hypothetical protein